MSLLLGVITSRPWPRRGRPRLHAGTPMPATFVAAPPKTAKLTSGRATAARSIPRNGGALCATASSKSLIGRAIAASPALEIALNRLREARAQEAVVVGSALPMLKGSEGGALGTGSDLARGRASPPLVSAENGTGFTQINDLVGFDAGGSRSVRQIPTRDRGGALQSRGRRRTRNIVLVSLIADVTAPTWTCARCRCNSSYITRASTSLSITSTSCRNATIAVSPMSWT